MLFTCTLKSEDFAIVEQIKNGATFGEDIAKNLGMNIAAFNQLVTLLEIKGTIRSLGCNQWALV